MSTFMSTRTSVSVGSLSASFVHEGHSDFGPCSHTSFESLRAPGAGGTQAENKPTHLCRGRQEVRERSLYNRRPRSLAAADHPAPQQS
jgi:hypothetical protein